MQERTRWLILAGLLLVVGVIAWRLTAGSYKADVQKVCFAEKNSGVDGKQDIKRVEAWAKEHLDTPEASSWLTELTKKSLSERGTALRDETKRLRIAECPLLAAYDTLKFEGEYRQDISALCSLTNQTQIEAADDDQRLHLILDWIGQHAKSPNTKALGEKLAQAEPKARPDVLREAGNAAAVYQCELVNTLLKPKAKPHNEEPVIELGSPQINGDLTIDKIVAVFLHKHDDMRKCYDAGLAKNPALAGRIMMKIAASPSGKVMTAGPEKGTTLPDGDVVRCVVGVTRQVVFPATKAPLLTMMLPLDFFPKVSALPRQDEPHGQ